MRPAEALVSRDAEQAILGALLLNAAVAGPLALPLVTAEDFALPSHRVLFAAVRTLVERGVTIDHVTLRTELMARDDLDRAGGIDYLAELVDAIPTPHNADHHARIVRDLAQRRALIAAADRTAQAAADRTIPVAQIVAATVHALVTTTQPVTQTADLPALLTGLMGTLERQATTQSTMRGVGTEIPGLDRLLRGWQRQQLAIVAARPSVGKSAFALHAARAACEADVPVFFDSLEMAAHELIERLVASESRVETGAICAPHHLERDVPELLRSMGRIKDWPLVIDESGRTPALLRLAIQREQAKRGAPFGLVIVDYLGKMRPDTKQERHDLSIGAITQGLCDLGKDLDVPVLCLAQLSRRSVQGERPREPNLSDLRDSGDIEQDGHVVVFLHPSQDRDATDVYGQVDGIVAKNRNGPTGRVKLQLHYATGRWTELSNRKEPSWAA